MCCGGYEHKDTSRGIIGLPIERALDTAIEALSVTSVVYLFISIEDSDELSAEAERKLALLNGAGVNIVPFERVVEITKDSPDDVVIHLSDDSQHRVDWIVHEPGSALTIAHLVLQLGVERNDRRNIIVNSKNEPTVRGVFAAGDCLSKSKHIMPAVNEGYIVGKSAHLELICEDLEAGAILKNPEDLSEASGSAALAL